MTTASTPDNPSGSTPAEVEQKQDEAARDGRGRFKRGTSGNPRGRKRGSGWVQKTREELRGASLSVLTVMHKMAMTGDTSAARLVLERGLPALRPGDDLIDLPAAKTGTLAGRATAVVDACVRGKITPGQAGDLLAHFHTLARVVEVDDLAVRVAALE